MAAVLVFAAMDIISTPADAQTLGVALNATNLTWTTSGTDGAQGWSVETTHTEDGVSAAQSGSISSASATSVLQTTVTGPGTLTFWWYDATLEGVKLFPSPSTASTWRARPARCLPGNSKRSMLVQAPRR